MLSILKRIVPILAVALAATVVNGQSVKYVDDDAPLGDDGLTWSTAYKYLQDALYAAVGDPAITEIRVAGGIYKPDQDEAGNATPGDHSATFQLQSSVAIAGGYAGLADPGDPDARNVGLFETTLSGDLNSDDDPADFPSGPTYSDNSYHVVTSSGTDATATLDGFTIIGGNATGNLTPNQRGGGIKNDDSNPGSPTIKTCTVRGNVALSLGGGMFSVGGNPTLISSVIEGNLADQGGGLYASGGSLTLRNCTLSHNTAQGIIAWGGGMFAFASNATLTNCNFIGNTATRAGGLIETNSSNVILINCWFSGNSAVDDGGALLTTDNMTLANCTFSGNSAGDEGGGAVWVGAASPSLANCILWGNTASVGAQIRVVQGGTPVVMYSCVEGGWSGAGNISVDPLFADADGGDDIVGTEDDNLRLLPNSPCIDSADNTAVPPDAVDLDGDGDTTERTPLDLDLNPRFLEAPPPGGTGVPDPPLYPDIVDMGAYEFSSDCNTNGVLDACDMDCGTSGGPCDVPGCGESADCNTNGVLDECEELEFISVCNSVLHAGAGEFCLTIGPPPDDSSVEARFAGVQNLVCEMSVPVDAATAISDNVQALCVNNAYAGTVGVSPTAGPMCPNSRLEITFDPALPDQDCCQISLNGMTSAYGQPVVGGFTVATLAGDVSRDGEVTVSDKNLIKPKIGQPVDSQNFYFDVSCDGEISVSDKALVKPKIGNVAMACP
jgi:predicted outer membrane repeat protein